MPLIPISTDVQGADLNTGQAGIPGAAYAQLGNTVENMSLQIGQKLLQEEAVQTVSRTKAERELQSKQKLKELEANSPDGYVWENKNGVPTQVKDENGEPRTVTSVYRDWANQQYEQDQLKMPSRIAQDLYQRDMLNTYTDNISRAREIEYSKRHDAILATAIQTADIRAMDIYTNPGEISAVLEKSRENTIQNASLVGVGRLNASELAKLDTAQSDHLAENWGEGIILKANEAISNGTSLPPSFLEDAYDAWVGEVKPGNQFVDDVQHAATKKRREELLAENKKRREAGLPEQRLPEEAKTITSMASDETRDRIAEKFLSIMRSRVHRVGVEFDAQTTGLAAYGKNKTLSPQQRKAHQSQIAAYEASTIQYVAQGSVLPLEAQQGIVKVRVSDQLGAYLGSRNYWSLPDSEKRKVEAAGSAKAEKIGRDIYAHFQANALMKNKFQENSVIGTAKLEWDKAMEAERESMRSKGRDNVAAVAQEYNPAYAANDNLINPASPKGLATEIREKGARVGRNWTQKLAEGARFAGPEEATSNFPLDNPKLQAWAHAFNNSQVTASSLADLYESLPNLGEKNTQRLMDGMIKNGLPERYATGLLVNNDRFMREQVSQVLVEGGSSKARAEYTKDFPTNMTALDASIQAGIQPYLPELEKMEAMRGRNTKLLIDTLAETTRINAIGAARRQTTFDADKAAASGVAATFGRLYDISTVDGHTVIVPKTRVRRVQGPGGKVEAVPVPQNVETANKVSVFFTRTRKEPELFFQAHPNIVIPAGLDKESYKVLIRDTLETGPTKDNKGYTIRVNMNTKGAPVGLVDVMVKNTKGQIVPLVLETDDIIEMQNKYDAANPGWWKGFWGPKQDLSQPKAKFPLPAGRGPKY